jgi:N-acetyl-anhydromuramoyl-L-alanine amidase
LIPSQEKLARRADEPRFELGLWRQGWLGGAFAISSPNFGMRPACATIDLVVIHSISLPPGQFGGREIEQLFTNQLDWDSHPYFQTIRGTQVSAHFLIRRDGQVMQFVNCDDRAWHAGHSAFRDRDNCNDFSIGIELEGLEGDFFEPSQYLQLARICQALRTRYPIQHIAGHEHIAVGRKFDPGVGFDWQVFEQLLGWPAQCFPASQWK